MWIIPQALTEPWYQSFLPHLSKTCFFLKTQSFIQIYIPKINETLIEVSLMKLAIRSLDNTNTSKYFFYYISAWLDWTICENKKETRKRSKSHLKGQRNFLVAWKKKSVNICTYTSWLSLPALTCASIQHVPQWCLIHKQMRSWVLLSSLCAGSTKTHVRKPGHEISRLVLWATEGQRVGRSHRN